MKLLEEKGGHRETHLSLEKKEETKEFIKKLKGTESPYAKNESKRLYLIVSAILDI